MAEEEKKPKTILYPRDPSLDPQLVWKENDKLEAYPTDFAALNQQATSLKIVRIDGV